MVVCNQKTFAFKDKTVERQKLKISCSVNLQLIRAFNFESLCAPHRAPNHTGRYGNDVMEMIKSDHNQEGCQLRYGLPVLR